MDIFPYKFGSATLFVHDGTKHGHFDPFAPDEPFLYHPENIRKP